MAPRRTVLVARRTGIVLAATMTVSAIAATDGIGWTRSTCRPQAAIMPGSSPGSQGVLRRARLVMGGNSRAADGPAATRVPSGAMTRLIWARPAALSRQWDTDSVTTTRSTTASAKGSRSAMAAANRLRRGTVVVAAFWIIPVEASILTTRAWS